MGGPGSHEQTIVGRLDRLAEITGDSPFVVSVTPDGVSTVSYGEFNERVAQFSVFLARLGVRKGDMVHLQLGNQLEFLISLFGAARRGAVIVPVNPAATLDDVAYVTSHAECSVSIVDSSCVELVLSALDLSPEIRQVVCVGSEISGTIPFAEYLDCPSNLGEPACQVSDGDVAAIFYTSGTTSWPKGVMLTHRNLLFVGDVVSEYLRIRPDDRWLVSLPLFHVNALGYSAMSTLSTGASLALLPEFSPTAWLDAADVTGSTMASLFAVHCRRLLASASESEIPPSLSLRTLMFAQHLHGSEREQLTDLLGVETLQIYGMTETVAPVLGDRPSGDVDPTTVGRPLLWSRTKVVDRNGSVVAPGVAGELLVHGVPGETLMKGYHQRPEETALALRGGWLHTGDKMIELPDGRYQFLGRSTEIIKPSVHNVSAPEVERVLVEHVSIIDASVIGSRSASGDEQIVAFVELHEGDDATPEELLEWAGLRLADYKLPHRLVILDQLPRNAVGKVLKRDLQILAED